MCTRTNPVSYLPSLSAHDAVVHSTTVVSLPLPPSLPSLALSLSLWCGCVCATRPTSTRDAPEHCCSDRQNVPTVDAAPLDAPTCSPYAVSVAALPAMQQAPALSARLEWLKTQCAQSHLGLHNSNHALSSSPLSRLGRSAPYLPHGRSMP
ncbi:hypothetical protein COCMIDRAFT_27851 [Bipolaris oryzae ATCC 44560]|uniref:Uncharacterized protein n=1 Tax=Bipolaris oryzae ATCC 44560 TaxID=930090 RepID=W6Z844_COCMI|nr:uncharacterized protein COCMIDRAFT_27851 [Bipolaris oryzae ATCC 44560]EUC43724.1 hypothetical protein COCMIDRAFT_27851 [Bipolaris oryzae ATCC 44560]